MQLEPETDSPNEGTTPTQTPITSRQPVIIPFSMRPMLNQNPEKQLNLPRDKSASSIRGQFPDSPPHTRHRAQQERMLLRSGKSLPWI